MNFAGLFSSGVKSQDGKDVGAMSMYNKDAAPWLSAGSSIVDAMNKPQQARNEGMNALLAAGGVNYRMKDDTANIFKDMVAQSTLGDRRADEQLMNEARLNYYAKVGQPAAKLAANLKAPTAKRAALTAPQRDQANTNAGLFGFGPI